VDCAAVAEYVNWLRAAGLGVKTLRLDAECSRDFYLSVTEGRGVSEAENVSLLDLDLTTTNVNIIRGNRLVFTRSLPFGTETLFPDR
jgi:Tfp pilus assembly PilM family ATPase